MTSCLRAPVKLYEAEPYIIARAEQPVSRFYCSVCGRAQRGDNAAAWPLEFCPGGSCLPTCTSLSPHIATGALPAVALVLKPRGSESAEVISKAFAGLLRILQFLLLPQPPLVFRYRSYGDLSSWHWNPGLGGLLWAI